MEDVIFQAKTRDGYSIKVLVDLLQCNIKIGNFRISKSGIKLRMIDTQKKILIHFTLDSNNFESYKYYMDKEICVGINVLHLHKMLKSIKKKDSIQLFMKDKSCLGVRVTPRDTNRVTTSYINTQVIQNLDVRLPSDYDNNVHVSAGEYQKMCKDMNMIGQVIRIQSNEDFVKFSCSDNNVYKREVTFGSAEDTDVVTYDELYDTDQLYRIIKISGMTQQLHIYTKKSLPLLIKAKIGLLGDIELYIKNKSQIN